jgi:hypothetical protein
VQWLGDGSAWLEDARRRLARTTARRGRAGKRLSVIADHFISHVKDDTATGGGQVGDVA